MPFIVAPARIGSARGFLLDREAGLRGFFSGDLDNWVVVDAEHPAPVIEVNGNSLGMQSFLYNEEPVWGAETAGVGPAVFRSAAGWIYNPRGLQEPSAEQDVDETTWIGDGWWTLAGKPSANNPAPALTAAGTIRNEDSPSPPTLTWNWRRWERNASASGQNTDAPWGCYDPKDGAAAIAQRRIVGSRRYRDADRRYWTMSTDKKTLVSDGGPVARYDEDEGLWIIGKRGSECWWQAAAGANPGSSLTLAQWMHDATTGMDVANPDGSPYVLAFWGYAQSPDLGRIHVAEVARWR